MSSKPVWATPWKHICLKLPFSQSLSGTKNKKLLVAHTYNSSTGKAWEGRGWWWGETQGFPWLLSKFKVNVGNIEILFQTNIKKKNLTSAGVVIHSCSLRSNGRCGGGCTEAGGCWVWSQWNFMSKVTTTKLHMVKHTFHGSTLEAEAGGAL